MTVSDDNWTERFDALIPRFKSQREMYMTLAHWIDVEREVHGVLTTPVGDRFYHMDEAELFARASDFLRQAGAGTAKPKYGQRKWTACRNSEDQVYMLLHAMCDTTIGDDDRDYEEESIVVYWVYDKMRDERGVKAGMWREEQIRANNEDLERGQHGLPSVDTMLEVTRRFAQQHRDHLYR